MSSPAKVRHLHDVLKRQERVSKETGLDQRVLRHIMNDPGYTTSTSTQALINLNYDRIVPFPMSEEFRLFRKELTEAKAEPGGQKLEDALIKIDGLLRVGRPQSAVDMVSLTYLRVLNLMSKGLHHGTRATWFGGPLAWKQFLSQAEDECQRGMLDADQALVTDLTAEDRKMIEQLRPFLLINWLDLIIEQAKKGYKRTNEEAVELLRKSDALLALRGFLERNPFLWQAAYNGLETASTLKSDNDALWFYERLVDLDPGWQSFDYSPGEVVSISVEAGMAYFSQRYRQRLHRPIIRNRKANGG
jgi:hypothetical protein